MTFSLSSASLELKVPIVYIVKRYMYYAVGRDFALSASFVLECFDGSEVTTREGNELVVQKENCVVEEIKEVELRSHKPSVSTLTRSVSYTSLL